MTEPPTHYSPASANETGRLEKIENAIVSGWAYDKRFPDTPLTIEVYIRGQLIGTATADRHRPDLELKVGVRGGKLAFRFPLPTEYRDVSLLQVTARIAGSGTFLEKKRDAAKSNAAALVGKEGWLYLCRDTNNNMAQYTGKLTLSERQLSEYNRLFTARAAWLQALQIPHEFFIIPSKEYIYPEFLPEGILPGPKGSAADQIIAYQKNHNGFMPQDLRPALLAAKPQDQLFYKLDTHWNSIGAFYAAREIIECLRKKLSHVRPLILEEWERKPAPRVGLDLHLKHQMDWKDGEPVPRETQNNFQPEAMWHLAPRAGLQAARILTPGYLQLSLTRETVVFEQPDASLPTAMFFHDSYTEWMKPYLAECFRRSIFLWQSDFSQEAIEREKPDIVLQCRVDRFMISVPKA